MTAGRSWIRGRDLASRLKAKRWFGAKVRGWDVFVVRFRVASFNLNYRNRSKAGVDVAAALGTLLLENAVRLVMIQELNPRASERFVTAAGMDWIVTACDAGADALSGGRARVSAIAGRGAKPRQIGLIPGLALPERCVYARIALGERELTAVAYHAPPGVSWGYTKVEHALALAKWVDQQPGPIIAGVDANTPEIDHPDSSLTRTHWMTGARRLEGRPGDDSVFGGRPTHGLRDALRVWLADNPRIMSQIQAERPEGPLAISHRTGRRKNSDGTPRRFDHIWVSDSIRVRDVRYLYEAALKAGTDHALVLADLSLAE